MKLRNIFLFGITFLLMIGFGTAGSIFWQQQQQISSLQMQVSQLGVPTSVAPTPDLSPLPSPSPSLADLQNTLTALDSRLTQDEKKLGVKTSPAAPVIIQAAPSQTQSSAKEILIYLGSGSTNNRDWTDIPAALATLNTNNYQKIKAVYFEAALSIIGGEAHARLINQTTGGVLYDSEIFNNTYVSQWKTSTPISLPMGDGQYMVQLKSSSGEMANLDGSRLHIFLQ